MATFIPIRVRGPRKDLTGVRYGKLTVKSWAGNSHWLCDCDCGNTSTVLTANLNRNNTTSCGCLRDHMATIRNTKHGYHRTPAYKTWSSIKRRCYEVQNASYKHYGAKGIRMYEPWINDPAAFIEHVGQPPTAGHTLDRIDNSQGYFPGNLRWATPHEQGSNKSNNKHVVYQGQRYTISQLARKIAEECGITFDQMHSAIERQMYRGRRR